MSNLINFNFKNHEVRTAIKDNGDVYFCLPDVANVLEISRSSDLLQVEKPTFVKNETSSKRGALDPKGVEKIYISYESGKKQVTFINEPNLYRVIFRSNKKEAVQFQNWVFDEVLPSIRKTGSYHIPNRLTSTDTLPLRNAVNMATSVLKLDYATIYKMIHQRFGVDDIKGLTHKQIPLAVEYVHSWIVSHKRITNDSLYYHIHHLVWNTMHAYRLYQESEELFSVLSPKMIGDMPSFLTWAKSAANDVHQIMGFEFDKDHPRQIPSMSQSFFD